MAEIILYGFPRLEGVDAASPFCTKIHRALAYKGLTYRRRAVSGPSEVKRLNPQSRKVPVLSHDGTLIADSTRILAFLDQTYPDQPLLPADAAAAARAHLIEDWADESLYWYAVYLRWTVEANFREMAKVAFAKVPAPARLFVPWLVRRGVLGQLRGQGLGRQEKQQVLEMLEEHLEMLVVLLEDRFLVGETLTRADLAVFGPMQTLRSAALPESRPLVDGRPRLLEWMRAIDEVASGEHTRPTL